MKSVINLKRGIALATIALAGVFAISGARAAGTAAGTSVSNTATVNYSVASIAQTAVVSPAATFVVDRKVNFTVSRVDGAPKTVTPGQTGVLGSFTTFAITNTGNDTEAFQLTAANLATGSVIAGAGFGTPDNTDVGTLRVFVDSNGSGTFDAGDLEATVIPSVAADATRRAFIIWDVPTTATNAQIANVSLEARAATIASAGATLETNTTTPDVAGTIDVVIADNGYNVPATANRESDTDQFSVVSAALTVTKASAVISDPFNTSNPKAIPGAVLEFTVTVVNGGAAAATNVAVTDTLAAQFALKTGSYNAGAADVQITVGSGAPSFCSVGSGGCSLAGALLTVNPTAGITVPNGVAPANTATVKFRVTIL
jgi:uncharacterized repeat protein (TIGR01451 family)